MCNRVLRCPGGYRDILEVWRCAEGYSGVLEVRRCSGATQMFLGATEAC